MAEAGESGGSVSLVGAGPGDPGLLTRKGERRLREADVVVHDQLVARPILALAPPEARVVHRREIEDGSQSAINRFLVRQAKLGRRVVRLKGGDPFVFGRGGEEAEALVRAGVTYEVVPGVSSGIAVPAYAGIPLTHRAYASDVTFVTGHEDPTKDSGAIQWEQIVRTGGTLVVFMGVRRLASVVEHLIAIGADSRTPVAAIHRGTTPMQRTVVGDLSDIVARVRAANLDHPALVVIGRVVRLRDELTWFDRRPLWGRRVLVTRAAAQAPPLVEALRDVGAGVICMPVLEFTDPSDPSATDPAIDDLEAGEYDWVLFTSANGVRAFREVLKTRKLDLRAFAGAKVACVGPATAKALEDHGIEADLIPDEFQAEGLLAALEATDGLRGKRFLLPRAEVARNVLPDSLRERGGIVDVVPVYRTVLARRSEEDARHHLELADTVTFTSPSSVKNLMQVVGPDAHELLSERTLAAIGPITEQALHTVDLSPSAVARTHTIAGLVRALVEVVAKSR